MSSTTLLTAEQVAALNRAKFLDIENVLLNITELIELRKKYIAEGEREHITEQRFVESMYGVNWCNNEIKKLLSICDTINVD